jgi:hypothetical protein
MIVLHAYANGDEMLVPTDTEPLVEEVAVGTVIVFVAGLGVQVQESVQQIRELLEREKDRRR